MPKNHKVKSTTNVSITLPTHVHEFIIQLKERMEKSTGTKIPYSQVVALMLNIAIDVMVTQNPQAYKEEN